MERNIEQGEHPPPPPVTPDHSWVIVGLAGEEPYKTGLAENTHDTILAFMQEAGARLLAVDPKWCYVSATPGKRKSVQLPSNQTIAADAFAYATTYQEVHVLRNALEDVPATPHWVLVTGLRTAMQEGGLYPIQPDADGTSC